MPKTKAREPRYQVTGDLRLVDLTRVGSALTLEVVDLDANQKLGTIEIGQGSFTWRRFKGHKPHAWTWAQFAQIMNRAAYKNQKSTRK